MFHFEIHNLKGTIKARDICTPNTSHLRRWSQMHLQPPCYTMKSLSPPVGRPLLPCHGRQAGDMGRSFGGQEHPRKKHVIMEVWWSMAIRAISFASNHKNTIRQLQMRQLQTTKDNGITMDCSNELMTAAHHFRAIRPINCTWCMHFQWCTLDSCNQLRANQIRIFDQEKLLKQLLFPSDQTNKQTNKQKFCANCAQEPCTVHKVCVKRLLLLASSCTKSKMYENASVLQCSEI